MFLTRSLYRARQIIYSEKTREEFKIILSPGGKVAGIEC